MTQSEIKSAKALRVIRGLLIAAARVCLYGPEGIGKSTLAALFPKSVFIDLESGTLRLDVARFPRPHTFAEVVIIVLFLLTEQHEFSTVIIDSVDALERLLAEEICRKAHKEGLEDFGYGKGYTYLAEEFGRFLALLEKLRERGIHVVLIGHSTIRKFEAPDAAGSYDRYELKLCKPVAAMTKEWVDALFFINYVTKLTEKEGKNKAVGGRERIIFTTHTAAWDGKNRYSLAEKLPCDIAALAPVFAGTASTAEVAAPAPVAPARPSPVLLVTREQVEKLDLYWRTLGKSAEDRAKAFAWIACDSVDFAWEELTSDQAAKLITVLHEQMNRTGSSPAPSSDANNLGQPTNNNVNR